MMKKLLRFLTLCGVMSGYVQTSFAVDLLTIYEQALSNDQIYQASISNYLAQQEAIPIERANFFPNLTASASSFRTHEELLNPPRNRITSRIENFRTQMYSLNVTQPIFNLSFWNQYQQAKATAKQASYTFAAAQQSLIFRTATAYLTVLEAKYILDAAREELQAIGQLLKHEREKKHSGKGANANLLEIKSNYDSAIALVIASEQTLADSFENLRVITGIPNQSLQLLKDDLPLVHPQPRDVNIWEEAAIAQNMTVLAATYAVEAAAEEVDIERSLNYPILNVVGSILKFKQSSIGNGPEADTEKTIGLQLNVPIVHGGQMLALTRQARDNYETAKANRLQTVRVAINNVRQAFLGIESFINQVATDRQTIRDDIAALAAREKVYRSGQSFPLEVLNSQVRLFTARANYASDLYGYINSRLALKLAAGTLSVDDLRIINAWLDPKLMVTLPNPMQYKSPPSS